MSTKYLCPTCRKPVEKLHACGAVQYFCEHCKSLVSKSKVIIEESESGESE